MMNEENDLNPYAAPNSNVDVIPTDASLTPTEPGKVILKWLIVCFVAAGPSFYFGGGIGNWESPAVFGMIAGVLLFVIGYSLIEFTPQVQSAMNHRLRRTASRIAYITRMGISILFPIAFFVDITCGILSVGATNKLTGGALGGFGGGPMDSTVVERFLAFLLTTVIQGILLNAVLFAYMLIVYGFLCLWRTFRSNLDPIESPNDRSKNGDSKSAF